MTVAQVNERGRNMKILHPPLHPHPPHPRTPLLQTRQLLLS